MRAPPALVVLAAGASERMGACKALIELDGEPAILRLLASARALGDELPLVVTGAHHEAIAAALADEPVEVLGNPDWASGRTGGLARAVARRPGRDLCVAPVDHPRVAASTFEALAREWRALGEPARGWLAPRPGDAGGFGHPVLVGREIAARASSLGPDAPLRDLREQARPLAWVRVDDPAVMENLDRPEDLKNLPPD